MICNTRRLVAKKQALRSVRHFSTMTTDTESRAFSVMTRNSTEYRTTRFSPIQVDSDVSDTNISQHKVGRKRSLELSGDFWFRQDKTFLKFLTWINLESKDSESISISRLLAYNIFSQLKGTEINDNIISGIVKGLHVILKSFKLNSKQIQSDQKLVQAATLAYSKGAEDVVNLINYLQDDPETKDLMFTKEISGRILEGSSNVHSSLKMNVGHTSHDFINDELNYRVELDKPTIIMSEQFSLDDVQNVMGTASALSKNILVVTKSSGEGVTEKLVKLNKLGDVRFSVMDLSEGSEGSDALYDVLNSQLKDSENSSSDGYIFKTAERVLMNGDTTHFIDPFFNTLMSSDLQSYYSKLVEVHLKSPDEAWIHNFMTDIKDAHTSLQESLKNGILPESKVSFYLANQELKSFYSETPDVQTGIEVVQNAIDSTILSKEGDKMGDESSFEDHLTHSMEDATFIPANKPAKIIGDVVTICKYLLLNKHE